jgi:hydroxymethylglutaryl-CoA lyase
MTIVEVGPRDGLQNERSLVSTADKIEVVNRLSAAHLPVIEVSAFVSPKWVPQMADAAEVFAGIARARAFATALSAEPPGLERAMAAGVDRGRHLRFVDRDLQPEEHQSSIDESMATYRAVCDARSRQRSPRARIPVDRLRLSVRSAVDPQQSRASPRAPCESWCLRSRDQRHHRHRASGPGSPRSRGRAGARPADRLALHFHDTRGAALANVLASLPFGIGDASSGGLGGCPYAPGAAAAAWPPTT